MGDYYEIQKRYLPISTKEQNKQFEMTVMELTVTEKGQEGDCIIVGAKFRKSGDKKVLHFVEKPLLQEIARRTGRQFKTHGDEDDMTITIWRDF